MMFRLFIIGLLVFCLALKGNGQSAGNQYFIIVNGNLYMPLGNTAKGMYPILWYDKAVDPHLMLGGLGLGVSAFRPVNSQMRLKGQINFSKQTYWDEFISLDDENGQPVGDFKGASSDYVAGITATSHYFFKDRLSVGAGLGCQVLVASFSRVPDVSSDTPFIVNQHYKRVMPVVPVELAYTSGRHLFNIRYEQGLLNRSRKDLQSYKKDRFGLIAFEVGFKLN